MEALVGISLDLSVHCYGAEEGYLIEDFISFKLNPQVWLSASSAETQERTDAVHLAHVFCQAGIYVGLNLRVFHFEVELEDILLLIRGKAEVGDRDRGDIILYSQDRIGKGYIIYIHRPTD